MGLLAYIKGESLDQAFKKIQPQVEETSYRPQIKKLSQELIAAENERNRLLEMYTSMFDAIQANIYVCDMDTYEVLFVNKRLQAELPDQQLVGEICYKVFQGADVPCHFCTNDALRKVPMEPYFWKYKNPITTKWYWVSDSIILWTDGRLVRFESAVDISTPMNHCPIIDGSSGKEL